MIQIRIRGHLSYIISGLLFVVVSLVIAREALDAERQFRIIGLVLSTGLSGMGLILLWVGYNMRKMKIEPRNDSVPGKYVFLIFGYLFACIGIIISLTGIILTQGEMFFVLTGTGIFFTLIGLPALFFYFKHRLSNITKKEIERKEHDIGAIIGIIVAVLTLASMLVAGVLVMIFDPANMILGLIFTATPVLFAAGFGLIWRIVRK